MTLKDLQYALDRWLSRNVGGHKRLGKFTFFGHNAMHWAIEYHTSKGTIVMRPTTWQAFGWNHWYIYYSPDATPGCAWWGFGPGFRQNHSTRNPAARSERRRERGYE